MRETMINPHKFFDRRLRTLIYFVTTKCPLKCKHCFYNSELNQKMDELSLEEITKIARNLPDLELLQLSGGEPFLREDLVEIVEVFFKNGLKKVTIPTNGFFTKSTLEKVKKMQEKKFNFQIMVSIDGFRDVHNKIRGRDCFDNALETFDELKKRGVNVGFNVALSKMNYDYFEDLLKFLKKRTNNIDPILVRAKPDVMLSADEFERIIPLLEKLTFRGLSRFYKKRKHHLHKIYCSILRGENVPFKCLAGEIIAVLEPDGNVRSCEIMGKLGNVRENDYNLKEILKRRDIPKRCKNCIHPCFIGPSMSYDAKWMLKNIMSQFV